jgi:hypothetical protein
MSKYSSCLVVVLTAIACGGTTDSGGDSGGGTSSGGNGSAGHSGNGSAGKTTGGSLGTGGSSTGTSGSSAGGSSAGGSSAGGVGGGGTYDPRCPAHLPSGTCGANDNGLRCEYDNFTGCLCYESPPGTFGICQKVDPTCMMMAAEGGSGGAAASPPPAPGAGGVSARVALPPHEVCSCNAGTWACTF